MIDDGLARMLARMGPDLEAPVIPAFIEGRPIPKERPRVVGDHAFTPTRTADWEKLIADTLRLAARGRCLTGPVIVAAVMAVPDLNHGDIDNLLKAVLDGAQQAEVFLNDRQVKDVAVAMRLDRDRPGVHVAFAQMMPARRVELGWGCNKPRRDSTPDVVTAGRCVECGGAARGQVCVPCGRKLLER